MVFHVFTKHQFFMIIPAWTSSTAPLTLWGVLCLPKSQPHSTVFGQSVCDPGSSPSSRCGYFPLHIETYFTVINNAHPLTISRNIFIYRSAFPSLLPMAEEALRASGSAFTQLPSRHQQCPFSDFLLREAKRIGPAPSQLKELRGAQGRST